MKGYQQIIHRGTKIRERGKEAKAKFVHGLCCIWCTYKISSENMSLGAKVYHFNVCP
jgi:hypothetical protein